MTRRRMLGILSSVLVLGVLTPIGVLPYMQVYATEMSAEGLLESDLPVEGSGLLDGVTNPVKLPEPVIKEEKVNPFAFKSIGTYTLTAYCPCAICCGQYAGPHQNKTTSIGVGAYEGVTVAVDPRKIPYGTKLYIEGLGVRIAGDCGGAIKGNKIDVYYKTHETALASGLGHTPRKVYILETDEG